MKEHWQKYLHELLTRPAGGLSIEERRFTESMAVNAADTSRDMPGEYQDKIAELRNRAICKAQQ